MLYLKNISVEFIFVLDACTDNTESIIHEYMDDFNYQILHCDYHSCGFARNMGLDVAKGEFIWFVDGDDWIIYPGVLHDCLYVMRKYDLEIIRMKYTSNFFKKELLVMVWQYIYRRDFIGDLRFVRKQPAEDDKFTKEIYDKLTKDDIVVYDIPSYYYNYGRPGSNMTTQNSANPKFETSKKI
jgi:glycosyltransferase involved in cell wall biosynthesis